MTLPSKNSIQAICIGCFAIPIGSFLLGILSASFPFLVTLLALTGGGFLLWMVTRALVPFEVNTMDSRSITAVLTASAGGIYGYISGIIVGGTGEYVTAAIFIAFSLGLIAAVAYHSHRKLVERYAEELEDQLTSNKNMLQG